MPLPNSSRDSSSSGSSSSSSETASDGGGPTAEHSLSRGRPSGEVEPATANKGSYNEGSQLGWWPHRGALPQPRSTLRRGRARNSRLVVRGASQNTRGAPSSSSTFAGRRRRDKQLEHRRTHAVLPRRRRPLRVGGEQTSTSNSGSSSSNSSWAGTVQRERHNVPRQVSRRRALRGWKGEVPVPWWDRYYR